MTTCALEQRVLLFLSPRPATFVFVSVLRPHPPRTPEHRATPVFLSAKRNYTRGLSAVFVFPFFPVSFRSFARGDRWAATEAGRNQPRRAKSRPTDERSLEKSVENIFYSWQEHVQFCRINWQTPSGVCAKPLKNTPNNHIKGSCTFDFWESYFNVNEVRSVY